MSGWVLRRNAARVVLLNDLQEVFLIRSRDPADRTKPDWWEIPGGGIDRGETSEQAVARELREEAGISEAVIGPVVWTQHVEFDFGGYHFDQDEVIHVAYTNQRTISAPQGLEMLEAMAFQEARWWTLAEIEATDEPFLPPRLPALVGPVIAGQIPAEPIDISPEG